MAGGLLFAGVAWADAPSSVTVKVGTITHGDASSLAAMDGNTLDVQAASTQNWWVKLAAHYGQRQAGTGRVHYSYSTSDPGPRVCAIVLLVGRGRGTAMDEFGGGTHTGEFVGRSSSGGNARVRVVCTGPSEFTIKLDLLTLDWSP